MIFKAKATLTCPQCGHTKTFDTESDVCATDFRDSREIAVWDEDTIELKTLAFEALCPDCKYNKAA